MIQNSEFVMHDRDLANAYLEQLPRRVADMRINSRVLERKISAQSDDGKNPRVFLEQLTEHENKRTKKLCDMTFLRRVLVSRALVGVSSFRQGQTSYASFHHRRENKIANRIQPTQRAAGTCSPRRHTSTPRDDSKTVRLTKRAPQKEIRKCEIILNN